MKLTWPEEHALHKERYANGTCKSCHKKRALLTWNRTTNWRKQNILNEKNEPFALVDYDRLYQLQKGACAICSIHQSLLPSRLHVDHDHKTGIVRGLLCKKCNIVLLQTIESYPHLIAKAFLYLKKGSL